MRSLFVEAKKPAVDIGEAVSPAFQLRRYAWSAKLPISILTDFEEFAVYDCRIRPVKTDKAATARVIHLRYFEYVDRWDELFGLFAPEAIRRGSLERFVAGKKTKKGTAEVDKAFLQEIESWRNELARSFALRNPDLSQRDLNFAVQRTIDRMVFLRICEDRGIEPYGTLQSLQNAPNIYRRLAELFQRADDRYNSGLFHFTPEKNRLGSPDELTLALSIDDKPLKEILQKLYFPDSPYEFSVLPIEILGQVYEQFLGKAIRLTKGHQAKVEEKPEVRKAGGVYYTPAYIVDYIVAQTVGALLGRCGAEKDRSAAAGASAPRPKPADGVTPTQAAKLRVLDPACGSGSFLIGAYRFLLDWHLDWYLADGAEKHAAGRNPKLYRGPADDWRLTTAEKKRILLNNIYGVDIDQQAVEVTKLSLLLKVLEGESGETLSNQLRIFHERSLPDLDGNIKCGNSLIAPDFFNGQQLSLFGDEERWRINAFDWHDEKKGFGAIMAAGGFDAVIGNPPYVRMEAFKDQKCYLRQHYVSHNERSDLYVYFIERELQLLRQGGRFGMIVSNKFLRANYGKNIRSFVAEAANIEWIVDLAGLRVFGKPTVRTILLIAEKGAVKTSMRVLRRRPRRSYSRTCKRAMPACRNVADSLAYDVPANVLGANAWGLAAIRHASLLESLARNATPLAEVVGGKVCRGIVSGLTEAFVISDKTRRRMLARNKRTASIIHPFLQGRAIRRYQIEPGDEYLIYTHHGIDMSRYPAVLEHLRPFKDRLKQRATKQEWYELQQPQYAYVDFMTKPKIVFPDIATGCRFALDREGRFGANTVYFLPTDDLCLLGLLNSKLAYFYFRQTCAALEGPDEAYLRFFGQYLENFPVRLPPPKDKRRARLVDWVETILTLQQKYAAAKAPHHKAALDRDIHIADRAIDRLIYDLYELGDEEISIVEQAAR